MNNANIARHNIEAHPAVQMNKGITRTEFPSPTGRGVRCGAKRRHETARP